MYAADIDRGRNAACAPPAGFARALRPRSEPRRGRAALKHPVTRTLATGAAAAAPSLLVSPPSRGAETTRTELEPFNVTIRVFDPAKGIASGQDDASPVDSPDEDHAIASTTANAAPFTTKVEPRR